MFRIRKEFHFSASHQLTHLPDDHQCARLHGHNYIVVIELAAEIVQPVVWKFSDTMITHPGIPTLCRPWCRRPICRRSPPARH